MKMLLRVPIGFTVITGIVPPNDDRYKGQT